jgi:uncharacterized protein YegL
MNPMIPYDPRSNGLATPRRGAISRILEHVLHSNRRNALAVKQEWNDYDNPLTRFLICLILDASSSMQGLALEMLFAGLIKFRAFLCENPSVARSAEIAVVRVGEPLEVVTDFVCAERYEPSELTAWGNTPLAKGIMTGIQLIEQRKRQLESYDLDAYRALEIVITDAQATDRDCIPAAIHAIRMAEKAKMLEFIGVGINAEATRDLRPFCGIHQPIELTNLKFEDLFYNVSQHVVEVSVTGVGRNFNDSIIDAKWHQ